MELIEFKAGNKNEIRQSLANYCQVSIDMLSDNDIKKIYEKYSSEHHGISDALWEIFHSDIPRIKPAKFRAYHYHRTGSNGEKEWFKKGILNKGFGIIEFIHNLNKFYKINLLEFEDYLANGNNEFHERANEGSNYGPYAFISRKYAKKNNDYNLPEVIQRAYFGEKSDAIKEEIRSKIKPTLVEFWFDYSIDSHLDSYIRTYCGMLLGEDFSCCSFEPGAVVPYENIERVTEVLIKKKSLCSKPQKIKSNVEVRFTVIPE